MAKRKKDLTPDEEFDLAQKAAANDFAERVKPDKINQVVSDANLTRDKFTESNNERNLKGKDKHARDTTGEHGVVGSALSKIRNAFHKASDSSMAKVDTAMFAISATSSIIEHKRRSRMEKLSAVREKCRDVINNTVDKFRRSVAQIMAELKLKAVQAKIESEKKKAEFFQKIKNGVSYMLNQVKSSIQYRGVTNDTKTGPTGGKAATLVMNNELASNEDERRKMDEEASRSKSHSDMTCPSY